MAKMAFNVSQGSVATRFRCSGKHDKGFIANSQLLCTNVGWHAFFDFQCTSSIVVVSHVLDHEC